MNARTAFEYFRTIEKKLHAYEHAQSLLNYDSVTFAPQGEGASAGVSETLGVLSDASYELSTGREMKEAVEFLLKHPGEITEAELREVRVFNLDNEYISCIPKDEYVEYVVLLNDAQSVWHKAKASDNYEMFKPYLERLIGFQQRFSKYYKPETDPYDVLLDRFEPGLNTLKADEFFESVKTGLAPLVREIAALGTKEYAFEKKSFPVYLQRKLSDRLMEMMTIDRARCAIGETEHPFTTEFNKNDVRITTHYHENSFLSSVYSVIHEGGHALYELNSADEFEFTSLAGGVSMGVHESQSRFFENIIGRSRAFLSALLPVLSELFPEQMQGVSEDMLYMAANAARPSLIRIDADELTYPFHIIIRYELEKSLISGSLNANDLPDAWNEKYREYLGVEVPDDRRGVLQDSHWSSGLFGYFPSYALGSAYGAQILHAMNRDFDVFGNVAQGDLEPVVSWLTEHIYRYGKLYEPEKLIEMCCGEKFSASYYINYLKDKFAKAYNVK